jgi:hypothetical protein
VVGDSVGEIEGEIDGEELGEMDGDVVGDRDGAVVGAIVGAMVGHTYPSHASTTACIIISLVVAHVDIVVDSNRVICNVAAPSTASLDVTPNPTISSVVTVI